MESHGISYKCPISIRPGSFILQSHDFTVKRPEISFAARISSCALKADDGHLLVARAPGAPAAGSTAGFPGYGLLWIIVVCCGLLWSGMD